MHRHGAPRRDVLSRLASYRWHAFNDALDKAVSSEDLFIQGFIFLPDGLNAVLGATNIEVLSSRSLLLLAFSHAPDARLRSVTSPTIAMASMKIRVGLNCVVGPNSEAE